MMDSISTDVHATAVAMGVAMAPLSTLITWSKPNSRPTTHPRKQPRRTCTAPRRMTKCFPCLRPCETRRWI